MDGTSVDPHEKQETTVLKKAGIIVAVAAPGVLAVAPLAFAGDKGDWGHGHDGHDGHDGASAPTCTFANAADNSGNSQSASGVATPLLGILDTAANANAPVTPQTNAPIGSCDNLSDLVDVNAPDNLQDNSETVDNSKDITKSKSILDSLSLG